MADPTIIAAGLAAIPATVASIAAWRAAGHGKRNTSTPNGSTAGEMIYSIYQKVETIDTDLTEHIKIFEAHVEDNCDPDPEVG